MLVYEYKVAGTKKQYSAIDEAIRVIQFIRNKCLRLWLDGQDVGRNDLQTYYAVLAHDYPFAACLNSQARQASADRAWSAIQRFYDNCKEHRPGKKGYPHFQHDNRSKVLFLAITESSQSFGSVLFSPGYLLSHEEKHQADTLYPPKR